MTAPVAGVTASTKRTPAASGGRTTAPVAKLTGLALAFPPMPVKPETIELYHLNSARKNFVTGCHSTPDVIEGDILTTGGIDYNVKAVAKISQPVLFTEILLEQVK